MNDTDIEAFLAAMAKRARKLAAFTAANQDPTLFVAAPKRHLVHRGPCTGYDPFPPPYESAALAAYIASIP